MSQSKVHITKHRWPIPLITFRHHLTEGFPSVQSTPLSASIMRLHQFLVLAQQVHHKGIRTVYCRSTIVTPLLHPGHKNKKARNAGPVAKPYLLLCPINLRGVGDRHLVFRMPHLRMPDLQL